MFSHYQLNKNLSIQANIHNLFDKAYDTSISNTILYSEPRNFSLSKNYFF
nr:TonB-dependent receptor [Sodalis-like endosymbiont of Proechinophthirus fluctus]